MPLWAVANHCGSYTVSTPHTCPLHLFAVSLPPNSTTEQVNLNKRPLSPPCVRAKIRYWRDLQTEEAKISKEDGTTRSDRCNRLKSCSWYWLHWRGPIDLENKYKLKQGALWNWTDPTLLTTALEKFLDIYFYYDHIFKKYIKYIFIFKIYLYIY